MRRGLQGGREVGAAGLSQLRRAMASSSQGNVIRFENTPHTPASLSKGLPGQHSQQQHQQMPIYRSPVLEDFRINKSGRKWDLSVSNSTVKKPALTSKDIRGHIVEFSGDQFGSRFIQQKLESSSAEDRQRIFDEIMLSAYMLMSDVFGNYVIQKMLELGDAKQKALLATTMEGNVVHLSMHMYGCRVSQHDVNGDGRLIQGDPESVGSSFERLAGDDHQGARTLFRSMRGVSECQSCHPGE